MTGLKVWPGAGSGSAWPGLLRGNSPCNCEGVNAAVFIPADVGQLEIPANEHRKLLELAHVPGGHRLKVFIL